MPDHTDTDSVAPMTSAEFPAPDGADLVADAAEALAESRQRLAEVPRDGGVPAAVRRHQRAHGEHLGDS